MIKKLKIQYIMIFTAIGMLNGFIALSAFSLLNTGKVVKKEKPVVYLVRDKDLGVGECVLLSDENGWLTGLCEFSSGNKVIYSAPRYRTVRKVRDK